MKKRTELLESKETMEPFMKELARQSEPDTSPFRMRGELPASQFSEFDKLNTGSTTTRSSGTAEPLDFEKKEAAQSLISNFSSFFFSTDNDGVIQLSIGKTTISMAQSADAGKSIFDVFRGQPEFLAVLRKGLEGYPVTRVVTISNAFYELECKPAYENDKRTGLVAVVSNATEKINLQQTLVEAKERAERTALVKERLMASTSHEIRNHLNAIIGYSNLLIENVLSPEIKAKVEAIQQSGDTLLGMVNNILDLSKVEAGKLELERTTFNLNEVVSNVKKIFLPIIEKKGLRFNIALDRNLPSLVGDPLRLTQILMNLVGNAVKFTKSGKINVVALVKNRTAESLLIEFQVLDTGIGISKDQHQVIFEHFTQAANSTFREHGGTGLGLSIARKLVDLHGGTIEVISEPGKGSVFTFAIPFAISQSIPVSIAKVNIDEDSFLRGKKVLVVEDDPFSRHIAKEFLIKWGMEVSLADNGQRAVELYRKERPDIILMDIQMPFLNGIDTAKIIKGMGKKFIPIVALSAHAFEYEKKKCRDAGISYHLAKPYRPHDLKQVVIDALDYDCAEKSKFINKSDAQVCSWKALQTTTNGDAGLITDLTTIYLTISLPIVRDMYDCSERYDVKGLRTLLHKFLNAVKTMSILPLSKLIEEFLDDRTTVHDREKLHAFVAQIENLVIKSHHELNGYLIDLENRRTSAS